MKIFDKNDLNQILQLMQRMKDDVGVSLKKSGKWASGSTFSKIVPFAELQNGILVCGLKWPYDKRVLENGRGPGKVPFNFRDVIYRWTFNKGIAFKSQSERLKFASAVAYKMAKEGSVQFRKGVKLDIYSTIEQRYESEVKNLVVSIISEKIKNKINNVCF